MVPFMRDNGLKTAFVMEEESNFGLMDQNMKAGGKMTWQTVKADLFTLTAMFI